MDDFVLFHRDKEYLWAAKKAIQEYIGALYLELHEGKCRIFKTKRGVPFLGLVIFPELRRLKGVNVVRMKRRMKLFQALHKEGVMTWLHIRQSIQSWIGHASHANTSRLRGLLMDEMTF